MNRYKVLPSALVLLTLTALLPSCKKIQEDMLINGTWQLNAFYIDSSANNPSTFNAMDLILPYYNQGGDCCRYVVDFADNDSVYAYYITYDTFNYIKSGSWELLEYNKIYVNLDEYVDGVFGIKKESPRHFILTSEANHIRYFDNISPAMDTSRVRIKITRQ